MKHYTANISTREYFEIIETGKMNTKISIFDCSGFICTKFVPNEVAEKMIRMSKTI